MAPINHLLASRNGWGEVVQQSRPCLKPVGLYAVDCYVSYISLLEGCFTVVSIVVGFSHSGLLLPDVNPARRRLGFKSLANLVSTMESIQFFKPLGI